MSELPKKIVINQKQTDIGYLDCMGLFWSIHTKELANEVCHRYNVHEDLVKACGKLANIAEVVGYCVGEWTEEHRKLAQEYAIEGREVIYRATFASAKADKELPANNATQNIKE